MKKYHLLLVILICSILCIANAEYQLGINSGDNKVYLSSGDLQIDLENVDNYSETLNSDLGLNILTGTDLSGNNQNENASGSTEGIGNNILSENISTGTDSKIVTNSTKSGILGDNVDADLGTGTEFEQALYRMYKNGLTKYNNESDFRPHDNLTREESAKMIGQLYAQMGFDIESDKGFNCSFVDTNLFDPTLSDHIYNVCKWGIFRGNDKTQQYMPHDNLTKGQLLAVLLRIFEGKMSDESMTPWRIEYYVKATILGLSNETNLLKFDQPVSRLEASLLIYRFKNMVRDNTDYMLYLSRLDNIDNDSYLEKINQIKSTIGNNDSTSVTIDTTNPDSNGIQVSTGDVVSTGSSVSLDIIAGNETLTNSPEFIEAINWMYDMGITNYKTTESFMPYQTITRAQVAKMLDKFTSATNLTTIRNFGSCEFSDVQSGSEYKDSITKVCKYGVMAGSNDKFNPDQIVSKAEFVAILIRLFDGTTLDESLNPWRTAYYTRATEIGLISAQDTVTFTSNIARYEIAVFLYRMKVRLTMYNNLNSSQISDEIIQTVTNSIKTINTGTNYDSGDNQSLEMSGDNSNSITYSGGKVSAKIYINTLALNSDFSDGYVEILGDRYRLKKYESDAYNVGKNSFVRYGTLYSIESGDAVGSVSFIFTNSNLVDGSIRINSKSYYLSKNNDNTTYYTLTEN